MGLVEEQSLGYGEVQDRWRSRGIVFMLSVEVHFPIQQDLLYS